MVQRSYIQAANYTPTNGRKIDLIVIHSMEAPEKGDTAESVARYFANPNVRASAHYNLDNNSIVQSVREKDVAWHAPGANHNGIGLEHAGYARQSKGEWLDRYGRDMLGISAMLTAEIMLRHKLPLHHVDINGLKRGEKGFTTHNEVSQAFKRSNHWDPGPHFPIWEYAEYVKYFLDLAKLKDKPKAKPGLVPGSKDFLVVILQTQLKELGYKVPVDGYYFNSTKQAVKSFEKYWGISPADGVANKATLNWLNWIHWTWEKDHKVKGLRLGDKHRKVRDYKRKLKAIQKDTWVDDSKVFDKALHDYVVRFQRFWNVGVLRGIPTGVVTERTESWLNHLYEAR